MVDRKTGPEQEGMEYPSIGEDSIAAHLHVPLGLFCGTVRRTRRAMAALEPGEVLALHTDDP